MSPSPLHPNLDTLIPKGISRRSPARKVCSGDEQTVEQVRRRVAGVLAAVEKEDERGVEGRLRPGARRGFIPAA